MARQRGPLLAGIIILALAVVAWQYGLVFPGYRQYFVQVHQNWPITAPPRTEGPTVPAYPGAKWPTPLPTSLYMPYPPGVPSPTRLPTRSVRPYEPYPGVTRTPWRSPTPTLQPTATLRPTATATPQPIGWVVVPLIWK